MKQIWIIATALCVTTGALAQDTVKNNNPVMPDSITLQKPPADNSMPQLNTAQPEIKNTAVPEMQSTTRVLPVIKKENTGNLSSKDFLTMFADQLYITRDGKAELITTDVTLEDGTMIMNNGTGKTPTGKTIRLKNGQRYPGVPAAKKKQTAR